MSKRLRVAVVGYGTGGQAAALMLAADGHSVEVFERVREPGPVGAGFLLQPTGLYVLWELGLLNAAFRYGKPISRLYGRTAAGRPVMDMRYAELDARFCGLGLQRGALFHLLDRPWTAGRCLHAGCRIVEVQADQGALLDADGQTHAGYDLIVVADGSGSALRRQVGAVRMDRPFPWGAQWCLVPASGWPCEDVLQQRYMGARRMVGMLPVGTRPDDPVAKLSFFWSAPADALRDPVDGPAWRSDVNQVWPQAADMLGVSDVPENLSAARYRDTVMRTWFRGRAVLLGDAAHAMSPQLGQGVNMALLDALVLRDVLRGSPDLGQALARYQLQRRRHLRGYHFWSRWLTPLFQSHGRIGSGIRDAVFHPLSRLPGGRGQMLRVLTGTRQGWFGRMALPEAFARVLAEHCVRLP